MATGTESSTDTLLTKILSRLGLLLRKNVGVAFRFQLPREWDWPGTTFKLSTATTAAAQPVKLISQNARRQGIIFFNPQGSLIFVSPKPDVTTALGIPISPNANFEVFRERHGALVETEWYVASAMILQVAAIEYF